MHNCTEVRLPTKKYTYEVKQNKVYLELSKLRFKHGHNIIYHKTVGAVTRRLSEMNICTKAEVKFPPQKCIIQIFKA